jgi:hypothetical protein
MTDEQKKIIAELQAAAEKRHGGHLRIGPDEPGVVTVRKVSEGPAAVGDVLEEYIWNGAGSMLIRVCYVVWEHIVGEDHAWGRFSTQRQAEQRIAALFSSASLGSGEYYIARLFTSKPLE